MVPTADDVTIDNGALTDFDVATDDDGSGNHVQIVKLAQSADGSRTPIDADANGLKVADPVTQASVGSIDAILTFAQVTVDSSISGFLPLLGAGRAHNGTPTAVSADNEAQVPWLTRNGAAVIAGTVAEDVAHAAGEYLIGNAARRRDTPSVSSGAENDWSTVDSDENGLLWARAGIEKPRTTHYDLVTQASAFLANDQLCDEVELTGMSLVAGGGGKIVNLVLSSNNLTAIAAELWLYAVNPTAAGTNAVHNQTDANHEASRHFAVIDFSTWIAETDNMTSTGMWRGYPLGAAPLYYDCADGTNTTSLWGILVTRTAVTPGATTDYNLDVTHIAMV